MDDVPDHFEFGGTAGLFGIGLLFFEFLDGEFSVNLGLVLK